MQLTQSDAVMDPGDVNSIVRGYVRMETMSFFEMHEPYNFPILNIKWATRTYNMPDT